MIGITLVLNKKYYNFIFNLFIRCQLQLHKISNVIVSRCTVDLLGSWKIHLSKVKRSRSRMKKSWGDFLLTKRLLNIFNTILTSFTDIEDISQRNCASRGLYNTWRNSVSMGTISLCLSTTFETFQIKPLRLNLKSLKFVKATTRKEMFVSVYSGGRMRQ